MIMVYGAFFPIENNMVFRMNELKWKTRKMLLHTNRLLLVDEKTKKVGSAWHKYYEKYNSTAKT